MYLLEWKRNLLLVLNNRFLICTCILEYKVVCPFISNIHVMPCIANDTEMQKKDLRILVGLKAQNSSSIDKIASVLDQVLLCMKSTQIIIMMPMEPHPSPEQ